jgi:hypothetical protein
MLIFYATKTAKSVPKKNTAKMSIEYLVNGVQCDIARRFSSLKSDMDVYMANLDLYF